MQTLANFTWRGNVRELENLVQHMTILHGNSQVCYNDLPEKFRNGDFSPQPVKAASQQGLGEVNGPEQLLLFSSTNTVTEKDWPESGIDFNSLVNDFETQLIIQALKMTRGNKKEAARLLNLKRTTLLEKIKKKELLSSLVEDDEME
jgi:DNA-binding NtrC family response regulator